MRQWQTDGRRGFTLVELIVVIGLMGLLSTISIGGYFAASRGMAARGVVQDTASLIRQAMQTCLIDQVPTAVLFLNRRLGKDSEGMDGAAQGTAIAIKMAGRISYIAKNGGHTAQGESLKVGGGGLLIDEFADWNQSYSTDASDKPAQLSVRLYRMFSTRRGVMKGGLKDCCSLMCAWVGYTEFDTEFMIADGRRIDEWCENNKKGAQDNRSTSGVGYQNANSYRWGLPFHPKNTYLNINAWDIGDAYGVEIASLDLPYNYIFGTKVPNDTELVSANSPSSGVLVFLPEQVSGVNNYEFSSMKDVQISVLNDSGGDDHSVVGVVTKNMMRDQN